MKRYLPLIPVVLFAVFAAAMYFGLKNDPRALPSVVVNKPMPPFSLAPVLPGQPGLAKTDLIGRVSLVNVFGSWCGVCVEEHPTLLDLSARKAVAIYGVDWKDSPAEGAAWLNERGNPFTRVGSDQAGRLALDLGVSGAPETFVVDKHGQVRFKQVGAITPDVWRDTLGPLVAKLEGEP
jgi:cytochrome c biogenesis protein CcmG, thiol:disulfide interchange protein DsbE